MTEYVDRAEAGSKTRRPALDRLLADARARRIDCVLVVGLDRLARSVAHCVQLLDLFRHLGITFISLREGVDSASPLGRAVLAIVAALAQVERDLIRSRVVAGLRRARLENAIERAVILTNGPALRVLVSEFRDRQVAPSGGAPTLEATEREAILRALHESNWVLGGPQGAATRLGLKRTTLQSRIQKLGIDRPRA